MILSIFLDIKIGDFERIPVFILSSGNRQSINMPIMLLEGKTAVYGGTTVRQKTQSKIA